MYHCIEQEEKSDLIKFLRGRGVEETLLQRLEADKVSNNLIPVFFIIGIYFILFILLMCKVERITGKWSKPKMSRILRK